MGSDGSSDSFYAARVLTKLGSIISTPLGPDQYRIEVVDCSIVESGDIRPCYAIAATVELATVKLLQDIRDLPVGDYVRTVVGDHKFRLVNDMWSDINRVK